MPVFLGFESGKKELANGIQVVVSMIATWFTMPSPGSLAEDGKAHPLREMKARVVLPRS
jgi:hypothetical protein